MEWVGNLDQECHMCTQAQTQNNLVLTQRLPPTSGAYADIFFVDADERAFKLFKNHKHPNVHSERGADEDELRRLVFQAETRAYEIASADNGLKIYIPKFYGSRSIGQVVAYDSKDITDRYLLDCCLELQKLEGECVKFENVRNSFPNIEVEFHQAGIHYTKDMSAFLNDGESSIKLIDFATHDAYFETEVEWIVEGRIK